MGGSIAVETKLSKQVGRFDKASGKLSQLESDAGTSIEHASRQLRRDQQSICWHYPTLKKDSVYSFFFMSPTSFTTPCPRLRSASRRRLTNVETRKQKTTKTLPTWTGSHVGNNTKHPRNDNNTNFPI